METQDKDEEVIFTPEVIAEDEFVITESAAAENDIKMALDNFDSAQGLEKKYNPDRPLNKDEKLILKMKELDEAEDPNVAKMQFLRDKVSDKVKSDGSTASYYELPPEAKELQDLISHRNMNAQLGEIFRECYRYGLSSHCDEMRGAKKIKFYIDAEIARLQKLEK